MRFFTAALFALSTLAAVAFADNLQNPITYPSSGDTLKPDTPITIKWTPTSSDKTVVLILRKGSDNNLDTVVTITPGTNNNGEYQWTPPKNLPKSSDYSIEIKYSSGSNYSPKFSVDSTVTSTPTTATSMSASASDSTSNSQSTSSPSSTSGSASSSSSGPSSTAASSSTGVSSSKEVSSTSKLPKSIPSAHPVNSTSMSTTPTYKKPTSTGPKPTASATGGGNAPHSDAVLGKSVGSALVLMIAAACALVL